MDVSLWLGLLQHDHGVSLPEEGTGRTQLSQLDQLQHHLVGQIDINYENQIPFKKKISVHKSSEMLWNRKTINITDRNEV